jgi:hypothetical protein
MSRAARIAHVVITVALAVVAAVLIVAELK